MQGFKSFLFKFITFTFALSFCVISITYTGNVLFSFESKAVDTESISSKKSVIIDPGHGGIDGGAISTVNGIAEKDLNLDISLKLASILEFCGNNVIMTRYDDVLLYDDNVRGTKKAQDLKNRLKFTENNPDSIFVSIHMNTFPREQYCGLQVFYSPNNEESKTLAETVQKNNALYLQNDNTRQIKRANSNIYILWRAQIPSILIECGFLSNKDEAELLSTDEYRSKLTAVIFGSLIEHLN